MVEGDEVVDGLLEERMALLCKYKVIRNTDWDGLGKDNRIYQERIHRAETSDIQVEIYSTIIMEDEVAYRIGMLNRVSVTVKGV